MSIENESHLEKISHKNELNKLSFEVIKNSDFSYFLDKNLSDLKNNKLFKQIIKECKKINILILNNYKKYGIDLKTAQEKLHKLGIKVLINGKYGAETHLAILKFQNQIGLKANGIINLNTLRFLFPYIINKKTKNINIKEILEKMNKEKNLNINKISFEVIKNNDFSYFLDKNLSDLKKDILFKKVVKESKKINISILNNYKKYGINLKKTQEKFYKLGIKIGIDGIYGPETHLAILKFQNQIGLKANGIINENTLRFLFPHTFKTLNKKIEQKNPEEIEKYIFEKFDVKSKKEKTKKLTKIIERNIKPHHIKKIKKRIEKKKNIEKENNSILRQFLSYPKEKRLELLTKEKRKGYIILDFYKNFTQKEGLILEKYLKISDIIPEKYNYVIILKRTELKNRKRKILHVQYFDITQKKGEKFETIFKNTIFTRYRKSIILNGYAIKPIKKENKKFKSNKEIIEFFYGNLINNFYDKYFKNSFITKKFIYNLLKQESHFDPSAISSTGTRGLGQVTLLTASWIIEKNKKYFKNNNFFIKDINSITRHREFLSFKKGQKIYFKGVDTQFYDPERSIKLTLNYLFYIKKYIDKYFPNNTDKVKQALTIIAYNSGYKIKKYFIKTKQTSNLSINKIKQIYYKLLKKNKINELNNYLKILDK